MPFEETTSTNDVIEKLARDGVKEGAVVSGSPAFDSRDWLRAITAFPKLPDLLKTVRQLEKRLERLEGVSTGSPTT